MVENSIVDRSIVENSNVQKNIVVNSIWREKLIYKFEKSCEKIKHKRDLFPLSRKAHDMITREADKYEVTHTNTEQFRMSTVPYIQRKLNTIEKSRILETLNLLTDADSSTNTIDIFICFASKNVF